MAAPPSTGVVPAEGSAPAPPDRQSETWRDRVGSMLAGSPSFPLLVVVTGMFVWFAADEGGFEGTTFLPGGMLVLGLLAAGLLALDAPRPRRSLVVAMTLLAGYTAWCYLSIAWAEQEGVAWAGANRTALYALIFALFALWPLRGGPAAVLAGTFGLGVAGVGLIELLRAEDAAQAVQFFHESRLSEPTGYVNANVALWSMAALPCLVLSARRGVPAVLRGVLLGAAGLLISLTVLGQSRGSLFVLPAMIILAVVLVPGRGRTIVSMAAVGVATLAIWGPLTDVYDQLSPRAAPGPALSDAVQAILLASGALAIVGALAGLAERRVKVTQPTATRVSAGFAIAFAAICLGGLVAYAVVKDDPASTVSDKWDEFKEGGETPSFDESRLSLSVTTYRYDYWRVAWDEFEAHPFKGVGVDNFQRDYLRDGRSRQTPTYPHSTELRALSQTGIVGGLLFYGALAAALAAALPAVRRAGLAGAVGGCGLLVFAYFMLHGAIDWLWEFPALGGPAFALLAIAGVTAVDRGREADSRLPGRRVVAGVGACLGVALLISMTLPWLAERDLREARKIAATDPSTALDRLERSSSLNRLSPVADETAGVIESRRGRYREAEVYFRAALDRDDKNPFPYLQLGAIAAAREERPEALSLLRRARALAPRDGPTNAALRAVRTGRDMSPARLDELIREDIDVRIGPE